MFILMLLHLNCLLTHFFQPFPFFFTVEYQWICVMLNRGAWCGAQQIGTSIRCSQKKSSRKSRKRFCIVGSSRAKWSSHRSRKCMPFGWNSVYISRACVWRSGSFALGTSWVAVAIRGNKPLTQHLRLRCYLPAYSQTMSSSRLLSSTALNSSAKTPFASATFENAHFEELNKEQPQVTCHGRSPLDAMWGKTDGSMLCSANKDKYHIR